MNTNCMRMWPTIVAIGLAFGLPAGSVLAAEPDDDVRAIVDRELDGLVHYYEALHATPELSRMEEHTSADLAATMRGEARNRAYAEPVPADFPERSPHWQAYYRERPRRA